MNASEWDGLVTEITANMVLLPKTEADRMWNAALQKAAHFVKSYRDGRGLFQLAEPPQAKPSLVERFAKLRELGGDVWDDIDDPVAFIREMRGEEPPS